TFWTGPAGKILLSCLVLCAGLGGAVGMGSFLGAQAGAGSNSSEQNSGTQHLGGDNGFLNPVVHANGPGDVLPGTRTGPGEPTDGSIHPISITTPAAPSQAAPPQSMPADAMPQPQEPSPVHSTSAEAPPV
ncbi:unnamed protein product, partial [Amoebophrya sp. A120]